MDLAAVLGYATPGTISYLTFDDRDRDVLEFLGLLGKASEEVSERFPDFDVDRLIRAGLVEEREVLSGETQAHTQMPSQVVQRYLLTARGAQAVGLEPPISRTT